MTECRCGRPTRDNATACDTCTAALERALAEIPFIAEQLDITITQQKAASLSPVIRVANIGLPWHEHASNARRNLRDILILWTRLCHDEGVRRNGGTDRLPIETLPALSRWLMCRVIGIKHHEAANDAIDEITTAVDEARKIIFWKKSSRRYLGPCEHVDEETGELCDGTVYAEPGAQIGTCDTCATGVTVVIRLAELEEKLDGRLCTAAEIATYAVYLGLEAPRDKVRKRVHYWARHGRIADKAKAANGDPMFSYGEVRKLLYAEFSEKVKS